jgi:ABC-type uncharacterized transport system substrate-binding protein
LLGNLRRVVLGLTIIIAASAILLLSDLQHRTEGRVIVKSHARKWKIYFVQYIDTIDVEDAEDGVRDGLKEAGLREGQDFEVKVLNAQGDMATVSALIEAAISGGADMLVTFSTPTLQAALRRAGTVPVVYNYVASGLKAGAGKTNTDHDPHVTGVSLLPAYDEVFRIMGKYFTGLRKVGTLYCPAETNMVIAKGDMDKACKRLGYEAVYVAADTATDVPDAAAAMTSRDIDAVLQMPGNLTASAFGSIGEAARRARLPVFAFQRTQALGGAMICVARDYRDSGRHAGLLAARITRGENPRDIPLEDFSKTRLIVNLDAARYLGITIDPELIRDAKEVIGAPAGNR